MDSGKIVRKILTPIQEFGQAEATGGLLLIASAAVALVWANSSFSEHYHAIWQTPVSISIGETTFSKHLIFWINDGLMAIFFFLVGLEVKREILEGDLSTIRKASLPLFAAVGGIFVPIGLFFLINQGEGLEGWGIPMATDIAFSLGILSMLKNRLQAGIPIFLTAFAVVDDIAAILVLAIFYSHDLQPGPLFWAGAIFAGLIVFNLFNVKYTWLYIVPGIFIWYYFLKAGLHPTLAGVLVAITIPGTKRIRQQQFIESITTYLQRFQKYRPENRQRFLEENQIDALDDMQESVAKVIPPLQKLESDLNEFVAYLVIPLFAFANAGVELGNIGSGVMTGLSLGIFAGLLAGKPLGIFLFSWLGVRLRLAKLPPAANWSQLFGAAMLGGIGFTMSLFIANLAFEEAELLTQAKLSILAASLVAGLAGYLWLRAITKKPKAIRQ